MTAQNAQQAVTQTPQALALQRLGQTLSFLAESQKTWASFFPQMTRRAQQDIAAYLCVRRPEGCQFGEVSGYIKQNFLLDEATIKERIRDAIADSLVTIEPETLSSRTYIAPTPEFLSQYDHFLAALSSLLQAAAGQSRRAMPPPPFTLAQREALTASAACHVPPFEQALGQICAERGMSRARALEVRRSLQSISHFTLMRLVMEIALLPTPSGPPDILADDLAASLLALTRQNFQTTRDHINALISAGIFERRGGKTLHVGLTNAAAQHFRAALLESWEALARHAAALTANQPTGDHTVEIPAERFKPTAPAQAAPRVHSLTISGPALSPSRIPLAEGPILIGRLAPSIILLPGGSVSRTHCQIEVTPEGATLTDLGSTNGTRLRGARITAPTQLRPGDVISVGDFTLLYEASHLPPENKP